MEAIYHVEGRIHFIGDTTRYEYVCRDHLGNTRIMFSDKDDDGSITAGSEILQENHYYPFGLEQEGSWTLNTGNPSDYLYNGKELDTDFGLNWYHYGARFYDPAIGKWNGIDLLAEIYNQYSPYTYVVNNPIKYIDPDGLRIIYGNNRKEKLQIKRDIRRAKRGFKQFRQRWKKIKGIYKGSKKDLEIRKSSNSENTLTDLKLDANAKKGMADTNPNVDWLNYNSVGVEDSNSKIVSVKFFERINVTLNANYGRSKETSIGTVMPSQIFKNWETINNDADVIGSIIGSSTNTSTRVRVSSIGGFGNTYVGGFAQFDAISKTILVKVPKGIFGLKWRKATWYYIPQLDERIHMSRKFEWHPTKLRQKLGFIY